MPGSGPGGVPAAIALTPILSARYREADLERIAAAAPGARLVSVSLEGVSAPMSEIGGDFGGERAFVIDLGAGNRAFAQALAAGNELFVVTDSGDVNSNTYGTTGAQTGGLGRYSLTGGSAITVNTPIAGGASSAGFAGQKVYTGAANQAQKTDLAGFDSAGEGVELEFLASTGRSLWLRLR